MWPGFDSGTRRHMWVEFVGSLLCIERFSPCQMERQFSGKSFRKLWTTFRGSFSVRNGNREIPLQFARIVPFPGPFSQDPVNMLDGMSGSQ